MQDEVIGYIIGFLLREENADKIRFVRYGKAGTPRGKDTRVFILASSFFDKDVYLSRDSIPQLPLQQAEGLPLLFGDKALKEEDGVITVSADIIASAFFLLTRYEECVRPEVRDKHGRFPGVESLPYRAGFIAVPLVDEYGRLLRGWLRKAGIAVVEPEDGFGAVTLTHDVDYPWLPFMHQLRLALALGKGLLQSRKLYKGSFFKHFGSADRQAIYTFPWLIGQDGRVKARFGESCLSIYFLLCCGKGKRDNPYCIRSPKRTKALVRLLQTSGADIGLHVSYEAGLRPEKSKEERRNLSALTGQDVIRSRHHFLSCREPGDFRQLIAAGIRDDYSMGYSDVSGFRLGTCRPVKWMDPAEMVLTPLTLHPLTLMECTLDRKSYMSLSEEEAYAYAAALIDNVRKNRGELVLLWHNTEVSPGARGYHRALYQRLLTYITG